MLLFLRPHSSCAWIRFLLANKCISHYDLPYGVGIAVSSRCCSFLRVLEISAAILATGSVHRTEIIDFRPYDFMASVTLHHLEEFPTFSNRSHDKLGPQSRGDIYLDTPAVAPPQHLSH